MTRTRVRWARVSAAAIGSFLVVSLLASRAGAGRPTPQLKPEQTYVVVPGDTLWGIAARMAGPGRDPRPLVTRLVIRNHISSSLIRTGQLLVLPAS